jgi:hypothetical protein
MNYGRAARFIDMHLEIIRDRVAGIVALAIGAKNEGPIVGLSGDDFYITAFVPIKFSTPERQRRGIPDAREVCQSFAIASGFGPLAYDDIVVSEAGDEIRLQPYKGSSHSNPPAVNTQKWFYRVRPGLGIANPVDSYPRRLIAGTIGFFVESGNSRYLVSCNHVIARERIVGNSITNPESIIQPATMDLIGSDLIELDDVPRISGRFEIASLTDFHPVDVHTQPPPASGQPVNRVDAALAVLLNKTDRSHDKLSTLPFGGRILGERAPYKPNEVTGKIDGSPAVFKCGRTTGFTEGYVSSLKGAFDVDFGGSRATFVDQIGIRPAQDNTGAFSEAGDSGSPLLTDGYELAGMLFAGAPKISWANPLDEILNELRNLISGLSIIK